LEHGRTSVIKHQTTRGILPLLDDQSSEAISTASTSMKTNRALSSLVCSAVIMVLMEISAWTVVAQIYSFSTLAGRAGNPGYGNGSTDQARFNNPQSVFLDTLGNLYVGDFGTYIIRKTTAAGSVSTVAGLPWYPGTADGPGETAQFNSPRSVAIDSAGNVYVADYVNNTIRKVASDGMVSTFAGLPMTPGSLDGTGSAARFNAPAGVAIDRAGNLFVADSLNDTIRKITPGGTVSTFAGLALNSGSVNGTGSAARFNLPTGLAVDGFDNVYVADYYNDSIRRISPSGVVTTLAGLPGSTGNADGPAAGARFRNPSAVAVDSVGNVYVADRGNHTIRKITSSGVVTTVGGLAQSAGSADGTAGVARFNAPSGVAVDNRGILYVADSGNHTIRQALPILVAQTPQNQIVIVNGNASFSVKVSQPTPVFYQWQKDGFDIPGATSPTYNISAARTNDTGIYSVLVNYLGRSLATFSANLTVGSAGRRFPSGYWPGVPLTVELEYIPTAGTTNHTVTEELPTSFITQLLPEVLNADGIPVAYRQSTNAPTSSIQVTGINENGVFNRGNGTVKWGPFSGGSRRLLRYSIVPPLGWTTPITITGSISEDGSARALPVDTVSVNLLHPADNSPPANNLITIFELSAYATAWRRNLWWPAQSGLPELDYLTQAGVIWTRGEYYENVGGLLPHNWQPAPLPPGFTKSELSAAASTTFTNATAVRSFSGATANSPAPIDVTVTVIPKTNVTVLLIEEQLPPGWTALNINSGGSLDPNFNKVKWGPIFVNQPFAASAFAYRAVPPAGAEGVFKLTGLAAFDGTVLGISGSNQITFGFVASPPAISLQPRSQTVTAGGSVTFGVASTGTSPFSYQWQRNGANLSGQTGAALTLNNIQLGDAGSYRVVIGNAAGSTTSDLATLQVNPAPLPPSVTIPPQSQTVTAGGNATFTVAANGTAPLSYQWQKNGANLTGQTNTALALGNVQPGDAGGYRVVIGNVAGAILSEPATLQVNPAPVGPGITVPLQSQTVTSGGSVTFTVTANGTAPLTYQWQKNGASLSGKTNAALTLSDVQLSDAGAFRVVISNSVGSITSEQATLLVNPAPIGPSVIASPQSQTVVVGSSVTLSVTASGTAPLTYQWQKNGSNIPGAASTQLALNNVQPADAGSYAVAVSNLAGTATSASATLTVVAPTSLSTAADFDGDGQPDLIFQDSSGSLAAWLMNGTTLASAGFLNPRNVGDTNYRIVGNGDFNGDGREDLLFQHLDGTLAIWSMSGISQTTVSLLNPSHPGDRNWRVTAVTDLNLDRQMDIVFQHADGTLAVWFMNGINLTSAALFTPSNPGDVNWSVAGAGDFNADGMMDLIFQHTDGSMAVWLLDGTKLTRASSLTPSDPGNRNWRVVALADINRDGKPDLVLQHTDGTLAVWLMNGVQLSFAQLVSPPNPGGTWRVVAPK
jgi:hypothetical protein